MSRIQEYLEGLWQSISTWHCRKEEGGRGERQLLAQRETTRVRLQDFAIAPGWKENWLAAQKVAKVQAAARTCHPQKSGNPEHDQISVPVGPAPRDRVMWKKSARLLGSMKPYDSSSSSFDLKP